MRRCSRARSRPIVHIQAFLFLKPALQLNAVAARVTGGVTDLELGVAPDLQHPGPQVLDLVAAADEAQLDQSVVMRLFGE